MHQGGNDLMKQWRLLEFLGNSCHFLILANLSNIGKCHVTKQNSLSKPFLSYGICQNLPWIRSAQSISKKLDCVNWTDEHKISYKQGHFDG